MEIEQQRPETALYFTSVIAVSASQVMVSGHLHMEGYEPSLTRVMMIKDGQWFFVYDIEDVVYGTAHVPASADGPDRILFLGRRGLFRSNAKGQGPTDTHIKPHCGYFLALTQVGGRCFAAGTQNQVFASDGEHWAAIDHGLYEPLRDQVTAQINALGGPAADDLYAAGRGGAIHHWDGTSWTALPSPTTMRLSSIAVAEDGEVFIGGSGGALLRGSRAKGWRLVPTEGFDEATFEAMCWFRGVLYIANVHRLLAFDGERLSECHARLPGKGAFLAIDANDDALWATGDECVSRFDGERWQYFAYPE